MVWLLFQGWATGARFPGQLFPLSVSNSLHPSLLHSPLSLRMVRGLKEYIPGLAVAGMAGDLRSRNHESLWDRGSGQGHGSWWEILSAMKCYHIIKKQILKKGCHCKWNPTDFLVCVWCICVKSDCFHPIYCRINFPQWQWNFIWIKNHPQQLEDLDSNHKS